MARRGKVVIDQERCKGCLLCIKACPMKVLTVGEKANSQGSYPSNFTYGEKCIACGNCYMVCPDVCLEVYELEGNEQL